MTNYVQTANRCDLYLAMFMVGLSVCESVVAHADVLWQNGWTDRDAVWHVGWGERQSPCFRWGSGFPHGKGQFLGGEGSVPL